MNICESCKHANERCEDAGYKVKFDDGWVVKCNHYERKPKRTQGDAIRAMSNEELANFIDKDIEYADLPPWYTPGHDERGSTWANVGEWLKWLNSECEE